MRGPSLDPLGSRAQRYPLPPCVGDQRGQLRKKGATPKRGPEEWGGGRRREARLEGDAGQRRGAGRRGEKHPPGLQVGGHAVRGFARGAERRAVRGTGCACLVHRGARAGGVRRAVVLSGAGGAGRRRASASVKRAAKRWFPGQAEGRSRRGARAVGDARSGGCVVSGEGSLAAWRDRAARLRVGCRAPGLCAVRLCLSRATRSAGGRSEPRASVSGRGRSPAPVRKRERQARREAVVSRPRRKPSRSASCRRRAERGLLYLAREVSPLGVTAPRGFAWGAERRAVRGPAVSVSRNAERARAAEAASLFARAGAARRRRGAAARGR